MSKIILVIGGSCSGKTTYVKKHFLGSELKNIEASSPVRHCISGDTLLIGNYNIGKACEGADTIGFTQSPIAAQFICDNIDKYKTIVAEGERITKNHFWETMKELFIAGHEIDVYYFKVTLEEAKARKTATRIGQLWKGGANFSESFLKMTITKARNFAARSKEYGFNLIEVEGKCVA